MTHGNLREQSRVTSLPQPLAYGQGKHALAQDSDSVWFGRRWLVFGSAKGRACRVARPLDAVGR